jgi:hypothetical protein
MGTRVGSLYGEILRFQKRIGLCQEGSAGDEDVSAAAGGRVVVEGTKVDDAAHSRDGHRDAGDQRPVGRRVVEVVGEPVTRGAHTAEQQQAVTPQGGKLE